jgi:hypothetical protein
VGDDEAEKDGGEVSFKVSRVARSDFTKVSAALQ